MTQPITGRCLCGAITLTIGEFDGKVGACHCGMCRRWNGAPSLSLPGKDMKVSGEEHLRIFASSPWAERAFCGRCGSGLFYRLKKTGECYVSAGLFDDLPGAVLEHQIFIDRKPDWYAFANPTKNLTEAEVWAKFSGQLSE